MTAYNINYKTFETFMFDVSDDLAAYDDQGYLNSDKYIKIVQKCNADLSTRINPLKETAIEIVNGIGKLPDDFKLLDSAYICYKYEIKKPLMGITIEYEKTPVASICPSIESLCRNTDYRCTPYQVWKKTEQEVVNIYGVNKLNISASSYCANNNRLDNRLENISVSKDGDCLNIHTTFQDGIVYITYVSQMLDDDGNVIILDHPLTNEYYEYEVKTRIYEDLWLNGTEEVVNKLKYIKEESRKAKIIAKNFVNTFDFGEFKQVYYANRRRMAEKYFIQIM